MTYFDSLTTAITLLSLLFGGLQIALLVKIWMMTDDIRSLRKIIEEKFTKKVTHTETESVNTEATTEVENKPKKEITGISVGDYVYRKSDGKRMKVEQVNKYTIMCNTGFFTKWYSADEYTKYPPLAQ
ncbi:MAG TPA: hypothetical protein IAC47_00940 [Candidatus Onthomorpha intestinigallinarum]|uniref:Uncharacterized protein n=1 Tax=Candidatus Onthomorpha intestinigallinarum TaxID=2840880 RepID=A0A9D1RG97_9BACT|nr:hypothetical protein [Candidatus Onthomorpha intestinigallinarum]